MDISTIEPDLETSLILTAISALEATANATQLASAARGWSEPAAVSVTRYREVSFIDSLQNICIDAHNANNIALRDVTWELFNDYRTRPGAVTTKEVLSAVAAMREAIQA
jgi:hypothetical protein